ncbi:MULTISPECIES: phycobiliprotein lyase [Prochlorococcus]|uniref:phycobiliprotein lyase n=1 Tax=Prochlorococcus TaxID=1218 RepID=UPI001F4CA384|nr:MULTISPECIES: phycobiliprotein lyase [Prochlorococcus]
MRSSHSLAFKQFEDIVSTISIESLTSNNPNVKKLAEEYNAQTGTIKSPFKISWNPDSDWGNNDLEGNMQGSTILVPIITGKENGIIIRSIGYTEKVKTISKFNFLDDGTLILSTEYNQSFAEEKIWFQTDNFRCRSSIVSTTKGSGILQSSFCSEVRINESK